MEKIDNLDKKILNILSQNARIPFKDVAAECNVSRAAIHQRVQRLIDSGVITGSGFDVNPKSQGYRTCTYVGLSLERGSMSKEVVKRLQLIADRFSKIGSAPERKEIDLTALLERVKEYMGRRTSNKGIIQALRKH